MALPTICMSKVADLVDTRGRRSHSSDCFAEGRIHQEEKEEEAQNNNHIKGFLCVITYHGEKILNSPAKNVKHVVDC